MEDGRGFHSIVRVLGAARHRLKTTLNCACVDRGGYTTTTAVDVRQNKEHWNLPFSSYYFNCIMRSNFRPVKVGSHRDLNKHSRHHFPGLYALKYFY